ncbi:MAG: hypothetical protein GXO34_03065 [Deltaproteobacteria bacterium]|nr:hypothetical protein [Deltaproteobacteria bacterium]
MIDDANPITGVVLQPIMPSDRIQSDTGSSVRGVVEVGGRILHVRKGRTRGRRFSPIPYSGVNRRGQRNSRRSTQVADKAGDRVVTLLVPSGQVLDNLVGREVRLKVIS